MAKENKYADIIASYTGPITYLPDSKRAKAQQQAKESRDLARLLVEEARATYYFSLEFASVVGAREATEALALFAIRLRKKLFGQQMKRIRGVGVLKTIQKASCWHVGLDIDLSLKSKLDAHIDPIWRHIEAEGQVAYTITSLQPTGLRKAVDFLHL